jgi:uncharacterized GH25 family protein
MFTLRAWLAVGLVLGTGGTTGYGHELKVLASHLVVQPGERTTVYLSWGHTLPVDDLVDAQVVERYEVVAPSGSATALQKENLSLQANVVELKEQGLHQVVAARKPGVITFVTDPAGNRLLKRGPKTGITEGTIDYALRSQQFAKALIVTGPATTTAPRPLGLPLEIVPLDGPAQWRAGGLLRFRVLLHGKPVAEESLVATYIGFRPANAWCYATATDREGTATVRTGRAGTWVLRAGVRRPATGSVREQYDYESYTATLALEVQP